MLMMTAIDEQQTSGTMAQVRDALEPAQVEPKPLQRYPFRQWYMVVVRPGRELDAADGLKRNKVKAYWPNYEEFRTVRRSNRTVERRASFKSIIPGYVFSPVGDSDQDFELLIGSITSVIQIARTFSGEPLLLTEDDIQIIRRIEAVLNTPVPIKPVHNFKTGESVRFTDDLMGRWPAGKISRCGVDGRIGVEAELMGRKATVWVFPHQIERV
jgi:transcription antitermination factor NusG